jgi:hypothetical protein
VSSACNPVVADSPVKIANNIAFVFMASQYLESRSKIQSVFTAGRAKSAEGKRTENVCFQA